MNHDDEEPCDWCGDWTRTCFLETVKGPAPHCGDVCPACWEEHDAQSHEDDCECSYHLRERDESRRAALRADARINAVPSAVRVLLGDLS